jgi:hypothetical protein
VKRDDGEGRRTEKGDVDETGGRLFWGEKAFSEPKLLPVIHGLLTTTGCGPSPRRPQPMGLSEISVNEFVVRNALIFPQVFACAKQSNFNEERCRFERKSASENTLERAS